MDGVCALMYDVKTNERLIIFFDSNYSPQGWWLHLSFSEHKTLFSDHNHDRLIRLLLCQIL